LNPESGNDDSDGTFDPEAGGKPVASLAKAIDVVTGKEITAQGVGCLQGDFVCKCLEDNCDLSEYRATLYPKLTPVKCVNGALLGGAAAGGIQIPANEQASYSAAQCSALADNDPETPWKMGDGLVSYMDKGFSISFAKAETISAIYYYQPTVS
jgi:hypothetical protein